MNMTEATPPTTVSTYPAWQQVIREAQDATERQIEEGLRQEAEKEQQRQIKAAADLKLALQYFGIEADPTSEACVVDGLEFFIQDNGYSKKKDSINFHLRVCRPLPEDMDAYGSNSQWVSALWVKPGDQSVLANLAYAIDQVTEAAQTAIRSQEQRAAAYLKAQETPAAPEPPSVAEQLVGLIRQLIREETTAYEAEP